MFANGGGMVSKGLRAFTYQVIAIVERVTTPRKPLKPLLTIPRVGNWVLSEEFYIIIK